MRQSIVFCSPLLLGLAITRLSSAAEYYAAPNGTASAAGTQAAPFNLSTAASTAKAGDTVFLRGGTYSGTFTPVNSGTSTAWITFSAAPGELPILDGGGAGGTGVGSSKSEYIRFVGIASRNFSSTGFGNGWTDANCATPSNGNIQFINCIADGNGINGIAFYCASGVLIQQCIVAHNGNRDPSWSSGVNLFHAMGSHQDNIVRQTVSFENIDISSHHSDGSGFILDQNSSGARFENNIGFRNGGSCIRITNSPGAQLVNNTCYHDGLEPSDALGQPSQPGEIYFSDAASKTNALFINNLAAASGYGNDQVAFGGQLPSGSNNYSVNANAATPFFADPAGTYPDFHLTAAAATNIVDKGSSSNAPTTDIGFDAKCVKKGAPGGPSFWQYTVDYTYIASIGGVAKCFNPSVRSGPPDIGAYEYNASAPSTGGAAGLGGTPGMGGTPGAGGATSVGGSMSGGGASNTAGASQTGGSPSAGAANAGGTITAGGSADRGGSQGQGGSSLGSPANGGAVSAAGSPALGGGSAMSGSTSAGNGGVSTRTQGAGGASAAGPGAATASNGGAAEAAGCGCSVPGNAGTRSATGLTLLIALGMSLRRRRS